MPNKKPARQAHTEALEDQAANDLGLKLNTDDRFGVDAWDPYGNAVEIKSLNLDSASPAVQFAHNRYPEKYDSFLKQHCLVILHRKSIAEEYWLLKKGENGFWTQWIQKCKTIHGREEAIVSRMIELFENDCKEMDDLTRRVIYKTIPGAVLTKKQWSFSIKYLYEYGEKITEWPSESEINNPPPVCNKKDHPNMFLD